MGYVPLLIKPGINKENTRYQNEGAFIDGDKVRFLQGWPQAIGGWIDTSPGSTFAGFCRGMHVFQEISGLIDLALGTTLRLYIWRGGTFYDITPIKREAVLSNPFTTSTGSAVVVVKETGHAESSGNVVNISGAQSVGGITLSGPYEITEVLNPDTYTITHTAAATSTATGGGTTVTLQYYLAAGSNVSQNDLGYGSGTYGQDGYGSPRTPPATDDSSKLAPRTWSLDNYSSTQLIANPRGAGIFVWNADDGIDQRAVQLSASAPAVAECILVTPELYLVAFGAEKAGVQNLMRVRWSTQGDFTDFEPTDTNTAGGQILSGGTRIMTAIKARGQVLIHTDTDLIAMVYVGFPDIYGFQPQGSQCGLIAAKATAEYSGVVYWMSLSDFFVFDGTVRPITNNTVRRHVFDRLNPAAIGKAHCGVNRTHQEIIFFFATGTSTECNEYAIYNVVEQTWSVGTMDRTSWIDGGPLLYPIATDSTGHLYYQEVGTTANGAPLESYIETGDMDFGEGDRLMFVDRIVPDMTLETGTATVEVSVRNYPFSSRTISKGPFTITPTTRKIDFRAAGRQMSFRLSSTQFWRMGRFRARIQPDGER